MNQADLVKAVAGSTGLSQVQVEDVLKGLGLEAQKQLKHGEEITLPGIGKLSVTARAARTGRNPQTGEEITIAARNAVKLTVAKALKDAIN